MSQISSGKSQQSDPVTSNSGGLANGYSQTEMSVLNNSIRTVMVHCHVYVMCD